MENLIQKAEEEELKKNPINIFICSSCKGAKQMSHKDFTKHLEDVHKQKPSEIKGTRKTTMHMDGTYWYSSDYEWTLECGLKFTQHMKQVRAEDDPMRFEH